MLSENLTPLHGSRDFCSAFWLLLETSTYAFFARGEYELSPQWSVIAGFRWTEDEKDTRVHGACYDVPGFEGTCDFFYPGQVQNNMILDTGRSEGEWSGTFQLNWRPNEDLLLYAKYSRGNKAGSYNTGYFTAFLPQAFEFGGEVLTSYEGGVKSTMFDGRARLNGSVFYYDYKDFQSFFQLGLNWSAQPQDAEVLGGELELVASPWEGWEFAAGADLRVGALQLRSVTGQDTSCSRRAGTGQPFPSVSFFFLCCAFAVIQLS